MPGCSRNVENIVDSVPVELKLKIFKYLTPTDRIVCKVVCKEWLEILMKFPEFSEDRKLEFQNCFLHPTYEPISVFLNSPRIYNSLSIGSTVFFDPSIGEDEWNAIGAANFKTLTLNLTSLSKANVVPGAGIMLQSMTNLEEVHFLSFYRLSVFYKMSKDLKFNNVKHVLIEYNKFKMTEKSAFQFMKVNDKFYGAINYIICLCPALNQLTIENIADSGYAVEKLNQFQLLYPNITVNVKFFNENSTDIEVEEHYPLKEYFVSNYNSETFENIRYSMSDRVRMERFLPNCTWFTIPDINWNFITNERRNFTNRQRKKDWKKMLKVINRLENLFIYELECIELHDPIYLPTVKLLLIRLKRNYCITCVENLYKSVPHVRILTESFEGTEANVVQLISFQDQYLHHVRDFETTKFCFAYRQTSLGSSVRKLTITGDVFSDRIDQLFRVVGSQLTYLAMPQLLLEDENIPEFLQEALNHFPYLNYLDLGKIKITDAVLPYLPQRLRVLNTFEVTVLEENLIKEAFLRLRNLFVIIHGESKDIKITRNTLIGNTP